MFLISDWSYLSVHWEDLKCLVNMKFHVGKVLPHAHKMERLKWRLHMDTLAVAQCIAVRKKEKDLMNSMHTCSYWSPNFHLHLLNSYVLALALTHWNDPRFQNYLTITGSLTLILQKMERPITEPELTFLNCLEHQRACALLQQSKKRGTCRRCLRSTKANNWTSFARQFPLSLMTKKRITFIIAIATTCHKTSQLYL